MEVTVFAKKRTTAEGKIFHTYLATLKKKNGESQTVAVKFRDDAGKPKPENCPINIVFEKKNANLVDRDRIREDTGELVKSYTLWVSEWKQGTPYVDHSLDDFD